MFFSLFEDYDSSKIFNEFVLLYFTKFDFINCFYPFLKSISLCITFTITEQGWDSGMVFEGHVRNVIYMNIEYRINGEK